MVERAKGRRPQNRPSDKRELTQNSRAGNPQRKRPNCHKENVLSNQRGNCTKERRAQRPQGVKGRGLKDPGVAAPLAAAACRGNRWYDMGGRSHASTFSTVQVAGRRHSTQSVPGSSSSPHLEPPEVGPLRDIRGRPTYTSEVDCRQEGSETVMSEFDFFVSSLNDDVAHATDVMIVGRRALVCLSVVLVVLFAECGPFCALQACCKGVQVETVMSEIDFFASSTGNISHFGPSEEIEKQCARWRHRALVCGYGDVGFFAFRGFGDHVFVAECEPFCARRVSRCQ